MDVVIGGSGSQTLQNKLPYQWSIGRNPYTTSGYDITGLNDAMTYAVQAQYAKAFGVSHFKVGPDMLLTVARY